MNTVKIVVDKVQKARYIEIEGKEISPEAKEILMSIDDFRVDREDVRKMISGTKDLLASGDVKVNIQAIYSNITENVMFRIETVKCSDLEEMYKACQDDRITYDSNTGDYSISYDTSDENSKDILEEVFGSKIFTKHSRPCYFYMDGTQSFMVVEFGFHGGLVFVFDGTEQKTFDDWDEIPATIWNLTRYPIGFKKSKLTFDMCKHGNILRVKGESVISAECPIQTTDEELFIVGETVGSKLTAIAEGDMQPAIGTLTHTGMSYGRWSYGRNPLPTAITIKGHITVELQSKVDGFTIGQYGTNYLPAVYIAEHASVIAPESDGTRKMIDKVERYSGSTKFLGCCEYYYE